MQVDGVVPTPGQTLEHPTTEVTTGKLALRVGVDIRSIEFVHTLMLQPADLLWKWQN